MDTSIFRENDIRGTFPNQINEDIVYKIAQAYASLIFAKKVVVGMDVRLSSPKLHQAVISALVDAGVDVADLGLTCIDQMYFAVAYYAYSGGLMITASHNPKEFNGIKMVKEGADPIGADGIKQIQSMIKPFVSKSTTLGKVEKLNIFKDYQSFLFSLVDLQNIGQFKIVANANFGFQGQTALKLLKDLPVSLSLINGEPNGEFPKGRPDPFVPSNRPQFLEKIKQEKPDFGIAWDADADRVFFATSEGDFIEAYYTSALFTEYLLRSKRPKGSLRSKTNKVSLQKHPQEKIIYDSRYTWAIIDSVKKMGATPIKSQVGHTYIKQALREHNALFCGEASGHTYFRDYFFCESGLLPLLLMIEMISKSSKSLKALIKPLTDNYFISGEINFQIEDYDLVISEIKKRYSRGDIDEFDGISVEFGRDFRFNIRRSHTENLVRFNLESTSEKLLEEKKAELIKLLSEIK